MVRSASRAGILAAAAVVHRFFEALIRHVAGTVDNEGVAYAMDKTGRFFPITHEVQVKTPEQRKWWDARDAFVHMKDDERFAWEEVAKYPALKAVLCGRGSARA